MNIEELRDYCMSKKGVEETMPFGPDTLVFKVMGKAFLLTGLENNPLRFNVKCEPEKAVSLREQYTCILPGFHMNKKHWNTIVVDNSLSFIQLKEQIDHSYELVCASLSKNLKIELQQLGA